MGVSELGSLLQQPSLTGNRDGFDMIGALCREPCHIHGEGAGTVPRGTLLKGANSARPGATRGSTPTEWTPRPPHYQMV
jgi:hypothetical protein